MNKPKTARLFVRHVGASCGQLAEGISTTALSALSAYSWPGNVRELRNILERALVLADGGIVDLEHLPVELQEVPLQEDGDRRPRPWLSWPAPTTTSSSPDDR